MAMIEVRMTERITEAELARDVHSVLAKVRAGVEIIVEDEHQPVATITGPRRSGRKVSDCLALARAYEEKLGYSPVPDPEFARDLQAAIEAHPEPVDPPAWD